MVQLGWINKVDSRFYMYFLGTRISCKIALVPADGKGVPGGAEEESSDLEPTEADDAPKSAAKEEPQE